jgi:DNA repair protein RecO (recombination protein O)
MPLLTTDAIVLHSADYLESSRLLRLVTREAGVQSAIACGARSSRKRFGSAVDLFAEGQAQLQLKPGRDLHALTGFDVTTARPALALDLARFTAASAIAEVILRLVHEEAAPRVYGVISTGFDRLGQVPVGEVTGLALGVLWQLVGEVGFRPAVQRCAECHTPIADGEAARFHAEAGGTLCAVCVRYSPGGRLLPPEARVTLAALLEGEAVLLDDPSARAHQRLLREFLAQHLPEQRPLKAYLVWEKGGW